MATLKDAQANLDARHILSFSGGKDSTALAFHLLNNYPEIAERLEVVFCDTGTELPETYDYIRRFEAITGLEVRRIDALEFNAHSVDNKRNRNAFDHTLKELYGDFLPRPSMRWCTRELKIKPFEAYVGSDRAYSYIGIRVEENREGYKQRTTPKDSNGKPVVISEKSNIIPVYPFKEDGLDLHDVKMLLDDSGLGLPPYYNWRSRSGCYFCFYQQIGEWQRLKENHPDLFEEAKKYESPGNTWVQGRSLEDIEKLKKRYEIPDGEDLDGCAICHI
jgi:3'-phosphoadenosine 5'-phosphosulfate sulfotransferase (PAPS reductase)/FAD synthetase